MAAPITVRDLGGGIPSAADLARRAYDPPGNPLDYGSVARAITQLQNTQNELIARHNAQFATALVSGGFVTLGATHAYNLDATAGEAVFAGVATPFAAFAAGTNIAVTTAANTTAAQYRSGIVELQANGSATVTFSATAASAAAAAALAPALATVGRVILAVLAIPVSFTGGTTSFTAAMITNTVPDEGAGSAGPVTGAGVPAVNLFTAT
jgi:hypothetical protein